MENNNLNIMELPAIVMNDFVPFPYTEMRIDLSAKTSFEALKVAEQYQNMVVVLIMLVSEILILVNGDLVPFLFFQ